MMESLYSSISRAAFLRLKIFACCILLTFAIQETWAQVPVKPIPERPGRPGIKKKAKLPPKNLSGVLLQNVQYNFIPSNLKNAVLSNPTSLQFGPDERLYVSQQNGIIKAFTIVRNAANDYSVTATESITLINQIPNHNDDGTPNPNVITRQVTGILLAGTASQPILYVSSSDSRIGGGSTKGDINLDTNSGIISRLTKTGAGWHKVDLVRGLPRSEENHSVNGMQLDSQTNTLFVTVGGFTNAGAPSNNFAFINEYALSAAILSIDLNAIDALPTKGSGNTAYKYDLPTLDDPTRPNNPDGSDINDPFGGNDGLNQAKIVPGGPVQIFSPGYRNAYDLVITKTPGKEGRMYSVDNGANQGWGGHPKNEGSDGTVTNDYVLGEPGSTGPGPNDPRVNNLDNLHYIGNINTYLPGSHYAGHPAPTRANPAGAGLYTHDGSKGVWRTSTTGDFPLPIDWPPLPLEMANPIEGDFQNPGETDLAILTFTTSTNGLVEYTASNFNKGLQGGLLAADYSGNIYKITLTEDGTDVTNLRSASNKLNQDIPFASGFGANPLDVTAQGDDDIFPGSVWAATYGSKAITIFEPADFFECSGIYSTFLDDDNDCYSNADEIDNGTNPCSSASKPRDFDQDCLSDLNDPDDDNDSLGDNIDYFALDAQNGLTTELPINYDLFNNDPGTGLFGLGFTGLMSNKQVDNDYYNLYDEANLIAGGAVGAFSIIQVSTGDALGSSNNQENAFQFGINVNANTHPFTFHSSLLGPFFNNQIPQNHQSQGIYIGTGNQDNYLKVVINANGGAVGIEVVVENGGQPIHYQYPLSGGIPTSSLDLYLAVNPAEGTVQAKYAVDGGPELKVGAPLQVSGELLTALQGPPALAVGIIATSRGGAPFTATWDLLNITADPVISTGMYETILSNSGAPTSRHENSFIQAGDKFYLLGGRGIKAVQEYHPVNKSWKNKATTPMEIHHFQPVTMEGLIYIAGAFTGSYPYETPVPDVYIYNPLTDNWILGPNLPEGRQRGSAGVVVYNKKIYVISGILDGHNAGHVPWMDEYDPSTNTWRILPDAPRSRDHFQAAVLNNKLYLAGGRRSSYATGETFHLTVPEVDVFDFATEEWTTPPSESNIPTQRAGTSSAVLGEELIVIGGESMSQPQAHKETEAFNVNTQEWRRLADLNVGRHGTQAIVNNNSIYIVAGSGNRGGSPELNSMEAFYMYGPTTPSGIVLAQSHLSAPEEVIFETVDNDTTNTQVIALTNSGQNQGIVVSSIDITGSSGFSFAAPYSLPFVIPVGESINLTLTYDPNISEGHEAELMVTHSGLNENASITLKGVNSSLLASPGNLHFFSQQAGSTSEAQQVTLTNQEATSLQISSILITGTNSSEFSHSVTTPIELGPGASIDIDVLFKPGSLGTKVAELNIVHAGDNSPILVGLTGEGVNNPEVSTRINAGGGQLSAYGDVFDEDQHFSGGVAYTNNSIKDIAGTTEDGLYKSERYGSFSYNMAVPPGDYLLRLHFAETWFGATGGAAGGVGRRVFNVTGEGQPLLTNFDIYAEAGPMAALVKEFELSVMDGTLSLFFSPVVNNPKVSAIEIIGISGTLNQPPLADAGADQTVTAAAGGLAVVQLDGTGSSDPDGTISSYVWSDGTTQLASGATATVSLAVGTHTITLTVTDDKGATGTDQVKVTVTAGTPENQEPVVANPIPDQSATAGIGFTFAFAQNTFSDPEGGPLNYSASLSSGAQLPAWLSFNGATRTFSGTPGSADLGTIEVEVTASDGSLSVSDRFALTVVSEGTVATRINAGGGQLSAYGDVFDEDQHFSGGVAYTNNSIKDIAGTTEDGLYKSERYGSFSYNMAVPPGDYLLRLHFAETWFGATGGAAGGVGRRVFNVTGEGQPLLTNFDIYAEAGPMAALVKEFELSVIDWVLNLSFEKIVENPKVSAIEVISLETSNFATQEGQRMMAPESSLALSDKIIRSPTEQFGRLKEEGFIKVYPNPFEDMISIQFGFEEPMEYKVSVYDVSGKIISQGTIITSQYERTEHVLDLSSRLLLDGGVYLLFVESKNGKYIEIFKMIKN